MMSGSVPCPTPSISPNRATRPGFNAFAGCGSMSTSRWTGPLPNRGRRGGSVLLAQVFAPSLECLFADHGPPVALHCRVMRGEELSRDHALDFVFRPDPDERRHCCAVLPIARGFVGMLEPE